MSLPANLLTRQCGNERILAALIAQELRKAGVPPQHIVLHHPFGRKHFDLAIEALKFAVELDGWGHRTRKGYARDRVKDRDAIEAGWHVLRITTDELVTTPGEIASQIVRIVKLRLSL